MPLNNRIILASAGSGKTTSIIDDACGSPGARAAMITYTINNTSEIRAKTYKRIGFIPPNVTISTWYAFLLRHFVRPYQNCLYPRRVSNIFFVEGRSALYSKATDIARHYFGVPGRIYVDKVSKFACAVMHKTGGLPLQRFEQIFDSVYIDESQDLAGFDLELIELLMKSRISMTLVGDHRQATYSTNAAPKNKNYARDKIIDKFREWEGLGLCKVEYQNHSHRCTQGICDFAGRLHPDLPRTNSLNKRITGHDGVFAVPKSQVSAYMDAFNPQVLRYSRASKGLPGAPINYGSAKGMTFERVLIFPHKKLQKFLITGNIEDAGADVPKIYVAITRAEQSTAFVLPDGAIPVSIPVFEP